jgi:hypothetical protein
MVLEHCLIYNYCSMFFGHENQLTRIFCCVSYKAFPTLRYFLEDVTFAIKYFHYEGCTIHFSGENIKKVLTRVNCFIKATL